MGMCGAAPLASRLKTSTVVNAVNREQYTMCSVNWKQVMPIPKGFIIIFAVNNISCPYLEK